MVKLQFDRALALHQQGNVASAVQLYNEVLAAEPTHADALHYLGVVAIQQGNPRRAIELIGRAIQAGLDTALAHSNLGHAYLVLGEYTLALASFDQSLQRDPSLVAPTYNRGNALRALQRYEEALESYGKAVALDPAHCDALNNRGVTLFKLHRYTDALLSYERALQVQLDLPAVWNNRGNALQALRRPLDALTSYERALLLQPNFASALNNRGIALRELGYLEAALASHRQALHADPHHLDAMNNAGAILLDLKRYEEAAQSFQEVLVRSPEALYARGQLVWSRLSCCNWSDYESTVGELAGAVRNGRVNSMFPLLCVNESEELHLRCAQLMVADRCPPATEALWRGERYGHRRLRVAYLSADFHEHATAYLTAELFELHDRSRFEIIGVSFGPNDHSPMRRRLETAFDRFVDIRSLNDRAAAEALRAMEIDIAVDLKGFTTDCRTGILAQRPAPIQVSYLGFPGSMGAEYIDYLIADRTVIPPASQVHYAEHVVYLPHCYQPNDRKRTAPARVPARAEAGLPAEGFIFCCFNNHHKITPAVFDVWMRILAATPGSVLWLLDGEAAGNLRREAAARGIAPRRLVMAPKLSLDAHLSRLQLADLVLDTWPYNAHTTASDALWVGVPVLTREGSAFAGRVAASLLRSVGLAELIVTSADEYQCLALHLSEQPTLIAEFRRRLRANRDSCPLFNSDQYRLDLEAAYLTIWNRCERGEAPRGFAVDPTAMP